MKQIFFFAFGLFLGLGVFVVQAQVIEIIDEGLVFDIPQENIIQKIDDVYLTKEDIILERDIVKVELDEKNIEASKYAKLYDSCKNK